jgi:hypothetical protein
MLLDSRISRAYAAELTFATRTGSNGTGVCSPWLPTLPPVPADFPLGQAFALDHAEAQLLQEQMIRATQGSLLAHLLLPGNRPQQSFAPWAEPALDHASQTVRELVRNARLFSLAINGAALLYGLLLAQEYERLGYSGLDNPADLKRNAVAAWEDERATSQAQLQQWNLNDLWEAIWRVQHDPAQPHRTVGPSMRRFVTDWVDSLRDGVPIADSLRHREIVRRRETSHKGSGSRLKNHRLLQMWQGAAGTNRLTYQWDQVQVIIADIHDGLDAADAAA